MAGLADGVVVGSALVDALATGRRRRGGELPALAPRGGGRRGGLPVTVRVSRLHRGLRPSPARRWRRRSARSCSLTDRRWTGLLIPTLALAAHGDALSAIGPVRLSKYSYLTQSGIPGAGRRPDAPGSRRRWPALGAGIVLSDVLWVRKPSRAAWINAGREMIALVAAYGCLRRRPARDARLRAVARLPAGRLHPGRRVLPRDPRALLFHAAGARQARGG